MRYTEEETAALVTAYVDAEDKQEIVEQLAVLLNKTPRSIVGKLSKEGVYIKRTYKTKGGNDPVTKKELIHSVACALEGDLVRLAGLEKAPKDSLVYLVSLIE